MICKTGLSTVGKTEVLIGSFCFSFSRSLLAYRLGQHPKRFEQKEQVSITLDKLTIFVNKICVCLLEVLHVGVASHCWEGRSRFPANAKRLGQNFVEFNRKSRYPLGAGFEKGTS